MNDKRASLEIIAPTVEEAVENGLAELGLSAEEVDVEILDVGSRGLFGLGSRQARVRLRVKSKSEGGQELIRSGPKPAVIMLPEVEEAAPAVEEDEIEAPNQPKAIPAGLEAQPALVDDQDTILQTARDTVDDLLKRMKIKAQVTARIVEPDDEHSRAAVWVEVRGPDLSILIGPRSETLNALQYISGLIINKELGRSVPLVIDIEGFRARRIQQLRQLARRMADQAVKTGHRQVLEPMPAEDRRIIHIELRNHSSVTTESVGEDPRRKVTIIPKQ